MLLIFFNKGWPRLSEKKLRSMIEDYNHLGLFIQNGVKYMIKRKKFETFLDAMATI